MRKWKKKNNKRFYRYIDPIMQRLIDDTVAEIMKERDKCILEKIKELQVNGLFDENEINKDEWYNKFTFAVDTKRI